ncbi:hypothetical protein ACFLZ7_03110 [Nanoarchaeota archaeon]
MKRKAQMEMMGLAIVVILLALGMFLLVRFMVLDEPTEVKKVFTAKELATNMISTTLKTDAGCKNMFIKDIIIDHAEYEAIDCNGMNATEYLSYSLGSIFNQTLTKWGRQYRFEIKFPQGRKLCIPEECTPCPAGLEKKIFPLPSDYGPVLVTMDICT